MDHTHPGIFPLLYTIMHFGIIKCSPEYILAAYLECCIRRCGGLFVLRGRGVTTMVLKYSYQ